MWLWSTRKTSPQFHIGTSLAPPLEARPPRDRERIALVARLIRRVPPTFVGAYTKTHHYPKLDPRPFGEGAHRPDTSVLKLIERSITSLRFLY